MPSASPFHRLGLMLAFLVLLASGRTYAGAQVVQLPTWGQQSPATSPAARWGASTAYNVATGQLVLFGGSGFPNDTWTWSGTWTQLSPSSSPAGRNMSSMAYDPSSGKLVLFGGQSSSGYLNDTWTWDGTTWTQLSPSTSPAARFGHSLVYDPSTRKLLLFGGSNSSGYLNDTWTWDGTTWTQLSPSTSPVARFGHNLAYDPSTAKLILFGGQNSGGYLNDTWTWDGTTWTQQSPTSIPTARYLASMAYDPSIEQLVLFGGQYTSNGYLNDTWTWSGNTWVQLSPSVSPSGRAGASVASDAATGNVLLFGGYRSGSLSDTWLLQAASINVGTANVCPSGATTPSPCSQSATVSYSVPAGMTIGSIQILTQGTTGKDFQATPSDASTTLCTAQTYASTTTCTVDVTFAPLAPGTRKGAVVIADGSGNVLATTYLYGFGIGPQVAYRPGTLSVLGSGYQPSGVTVDMSGNLIVTDYTNGGEVKEIPYSGGSYGTPVLLGSGFNNPLGVAMDGSGNVFVADTSNNAVKKIPYRGGSYGTPVTLGSGFSWPTGVVVDVSGNVFVADYLNGAVKEIPYSGGSYGTPVMLASGFRPFGVAVDVSGNVIVTDYTNGLVKKIPYSSGSYGTPVTLGSGFNHPAGVALDGSGNIFFADSGNNVVKEIPYSGGSYGTPVTLPGSFSFLQGVVVDGSGNIFIADTGNNAVKKLDFADAPSLNFASTAVGSTSSDSPQAVTLLNIGNADLSFPIPAPTGNNPSISTGFTWNSSASGACPQISSSASSAGTLTAGSSCALSISFSPTTAGTVSGSLTLKDNALNASYATQAISLNGTATSLIPTVTGVSPSSGPTAGGTNVTITGTNLANATAVNFGGAAATNVTAVSATAVTATAPAGSGTVDITVTTPNGTSVTSAADRFTYNQAIGSFTVTGLSAGTAGTAQTITVTAKGVGGSTYTGYTGTVHFTSSDTQAVLPTNYTFTAGDNGVHTFSVTLKTASTQSVSVQDTVTTSATGTASGNISAGAVASYFLDAPGAVPFYTAFSFNAYARDAYGNTATSYNGTAVMSSSDPGFSNLGPFTFANGATMVYSAFKTAGNQTLTLTDTSSPSVTGTATLYMAPGPVHGLAVSSPSSTTAGQAVSVTVTARDLFNNTVNGYTGTVSFSSTDTNASLPGSYTFAAGDNGTHTFSATLRTPGSQTITVTDAVNSVSGTSAQITVTMPLLVVTTAADDAGTASNCTLQTTRGTGADSSCSLRDALLEAATLGIADITFDSTQFSTTKTIAVSHGTLTIPAYTTITGATSGSGLTQTNLVTVDGGGSANDFSIFTAGSGVTGSTIQNLIITNGYVNSQGGAINNSGALTVTGCTFSNNYAGGYVSGGGNGGGAIFTSGTLIVSNSTFSGNTSAPGGAISLVSGTAAISNSTFFGNTAQSTYAGGAIFVNGGAALSVSNSTFSGNTAAGGGAIMNYGTLTMTNSIIANSSGGGLLNSGTMTVSNSLIGANSGSNCGGASCPTNGVNGNNIGASGVLLTVLGSRGGPTQTILPAPGSPAICLGSASNAAGANITSDQRGVAMTLTSSNASAYTGVGGYCAVGAIDAGAVQTNYALSFSTQPSDVVQNVTMSPAPAVTLKENGVAFTVSSVTIPLTLTSTPVGAALSGGSVSTSAGIATYNSLQVDTAGTGDTLTASLSLPSISATSNSFAVTSSVVATQQVSQAFLTKNYSVNPAFIPVAGSGGTGTLTYSVSPSLPAGLSFSSSTGAVSGTPTLTSTTTTYTVTVTDAGGATASNTFALTVNGPVSATTAIASIGLTVENPVAAGIIPVTGSGGVGTLHYTVSPTLPAGIAMNNNTGAIGGLPTSVTSVTTYTVTVTDANGATATATFTLSVNPPVSATTAIASVALTQNHAAAFTPVTGSGGTTPLSYSVLPTLPAGLSMISSTGAISGTSTTTISATTYTVTVADANGATASKTFSLSVNAAVTATQSVAATTLTYGAVATNFTPVTGSGGTGTLTYSASPALPVGLSISAAGVVSGTPTAVQSSTNYTVTVTDSNGATASNTFTLAVNKATAVIATVPVASAITYGQTLSSSTLTGGVAMFNGNTVAGSFAWTTPATAPSAGTPSKSITFTPTDTANYSAVTGTVAVTVNKAAVTITWPVPSNIVYGTVLSATQLNATASVPGSFTYTLTADTVLAAGGHTLSVNFMPADTSNYATPVASTVNLMVTAAPLMVVVDSASRIYGAANPALTGTPTGLTNGDTAASVGLAYSTTATQSSAVGSYPITASITSPNYTLSVTQGMLTVTGATLTVAANNATKIYGTANPIFNGSVTGQQNGDSFTPSYSTTATTSSPVATYAIVPTVTGSNLSDYSVKQTNGILTITQAASRVALASSATSITPGQGVTLTATTADATSGSTGTPTGTITFLSGSVVLGTATLTNGVASFTTSTLAPGATYALSASYGGDTNFAGSTASSGVSITVASLDFTITPPTNLNPTVMPGGTVQTSFSITSLYGAFTGPVSLTATGLPTGATVSFSPSSIPANSSGTQTITMTIKLPVTTAQDQQRQSGNSVPPIALGLLLLPLAGMRRVRKSALLRITLLLLLSGAGIGALTGCGTGNGFNATASQNYTVTVTATAGSLTHNFQINLNVQ